MQRNSNEEKVPLESISLASNLLIDKYYISVNNMQNPRFASFKYFSN